MARTANVSRPVRSLLGLVALLVTLYGTVALGVAFSDAQWTPQLALDLEGGTQITLTPIPQPGTSGAITQNTMQQAVGIIRQRVNGSGVSEAEVTTQGTKNIIVALPGKPDPQTVALVEQAAQLQFRAVLVAEQTQPPPSATATPTPAGSASPGAPAPTGTATARPTATVSAPATGTPSSNGRAIPPAAVAQAGRKAAAPTTTAPTPQPTGAATTPAGGATGAPTPLAATPTVKPTDASDMNWLTPQIQEEFLALDCSDPKNLTGGNPGDLTKPLVTCAKDGSEKFVLGPAEVIGTDIKSAAAGLVQNSQGAMTGEWEVRLDFTGAGTRKFADVTTRLAAIPKTDNRNRFGIVLDGLVISAPTTNERIPGGQASITGNFTQASAQSLANQLKFGALPISFKVQTKETISALLGGEQLRRGLLAGVIGLLLVVLYSLLQYRALGFVTVFSLGIAGLITYGFLLLLSWRQGYRLSLAGVAGLIVAIGITADSFIVYFERVRDEVRDGRNLGAAVEAAWLRARRTILASDSVSFLAAAVLYLLAVGGVRGFAFTLGLTTLVDVVVVFLFTKPVVTLLARTRFFGGGHRLSGFDPAHLGRTVSYAGRGRVRTPKPERRPEPAVAAARSTGPSIAERKAAAQKAADEATASGQEPAAGLAAQRAQDREQDTVTPRGRKS